MTVTLPPFPSLLARYRTRLHLSQPRLAARAGLVPSSVSRLEAGNRLPSREVVARLADALELSGAERDVFLMSGGCAPQSDHIVAMVLRASRMDREPHEG